MSNNSNNSQHEEIFKEIDNMLADNSKNPKKKPPVQKKKGCSTALLIGVLAFLGLGLISGVVNNIKDKEAASSSVVVSSKSDKSTSDKTSSTSKSDTSSNLSGNSNNSSKVSTTDKTDSSKTDSSSQSSDSQASTSQTSVADKSDSSKASSSKTSSSQASTASKEDSSRESGITSTGGEVWIPTSGSKYHKKSSCSNMNGPTNVTRDYAISQGYEPCKRCYG